MLWLLLYPLVDACQMKGVATDPPNYCRILARVLAIRWTSVEWLVAYGANVIAETPRPLRNCCPLLYVDLEGHTVGQVPYRARNLAVTRK